MISERFVVGTGRCGSTLLSRMLAEHPAVLSIFEFFTGLDMTRRFSPEPVGGPEFARLIAQEHPFVTMVISRGYKVEEVVYPYGRPGSRYSERDPVPWLLVTALPRMTGDPDALFDETLAFAGALPEQALAQHYRALFDWLARRMDRSCWIERSGSSIDYLGSLHGLYPRARFVHLHRDGPETALSMREHAAYRLAISLMYRLPADETLSIEELRNIGPGAPREDDDISRMLASCPPVEYFGRYWSQELINGFEALPDLNASQYLDARFEDLIAQPASVLRTIAAFLELPEAPAWIDRAAGLVRGVPPPRFDALSPDEQHRLTEACRPGMRLLGRI
jgi:hypothetical protein